MHLTDAVLDEFVELYKAEVAEEISRADAREITLRLIALYEVLSKKLSTDERAPTPQVDSPRNPIGFRM